MQIVSLGNSLHEIVKARFILAKNNKTYFKMSSAELGQRTVKIKHVENRVT